jgi:hypothetical protein
MHALPQVEHPRLQGIVDGLQLETEIPVHLNQFYPDRDEKICFFGGFVWSGFTASNAKFSIINCGLTSQAGRRDVARLNPDSAEEFECWPQ